MIVADELPLIVQALSGEEPREVVRLPGSGNNLVARVVFADRTAIAKAYFHSEGDPRDRARQEYGFLTHLERAGVPGVPRPLAATFEQRVALYSDHPGEVASADHQRDQEVAEGGRDRRHQEEPHHDDAMKRERLVVAVV